MISAGARGAGECVRAVPVAYHITSDSERCRSWKLLTGGCAANCEASPTPGHLHTCAVQFVCACLAMSTLLRLQCPPYLLCIRLLQHVPPALQSPSP